MFDYVFTRERSIGELNNFKLDQELKQISPKVSSITIATQSEPYAVFVHCTETLTSEERNALGVIIQAHVA